MYISKIEIKNFRNLKNISINTNPKIILIGENKSGKSNLLYALKLLLDDTLPNNLRSLEKSDFCNDLEDPIKNKEEITISIELTAFSDDEKLLAILCDYLVSEDTAKLTYKFAPKQDILDEKTSKDQELSIDDYEYFYYSGNDPLSEVYLSEFTQVIRYRMLNAIRDVENDLATWSKSPLKKIFSSDEIINKEELSKSIEIINSKIDDATKEFKETDNLKNLKEKIDLKLSETIGLSAIKTSLDLIDKTDETNFLKLIKILSYDSYSQDSRDLSKESLGINNLLYYSLFMLSEGKSGTIFAIEEPEAHLHPHLQRLVFKDSKEKMPLILTTHSQNIISSIKDLKNIVLLKNKSNITEAISMKNIPLPNEELDNIRRYLDVTRSEILFSKGVILVEGIAEEYIVNQFSLLKGVELDKLGISICSVQGRYFNDYAKLLKYLKIPFVIITDGDKTEFQDFENANQEYFDGISRIFNLKSDLNPDFINTFLTRKKLLVPQIIKRNGEISKDNSKIQKALKCIIAAKPDHYINLLMKHGYFINKSTLEIELIENNYAEKIKELLIHSFPSCTEVINQEFTNNETSKILERINSIGKGRFSQLLSRHLNVENIPTYIDKAIDKIKMLVG
jgi:putative ATP-dependent endonuclease of OLD family